MFKRMFTTTIILAAILALAVPALADGPSAVAWLKGQQNADGGFGSPVSTLGATADVLLAAAAAGENALNWGSAGKAETPFRTALDYLKANVGPVSKAGLLAKTILALTANGQNPRTTLGVDLIAGLEGMVGSDGKIGGDADFVNEHCFAMIALKSARRPIPATAVDYMLSRQIADGTWAWDGGTAAGTGDNNTAAIAVVALVAGGVPTNHPQIQKAMAHLKNQQNKDGGFPYISPSPWGADSDANSTAVVMWAIVAVGQDPAGVDWKYFGQDGTSAFDRLRAFQNASGAFRWQDAAGTSSAPGDNFASTVQAIIALQMKTLPFASMDVGEAAEDAAEAPAPATLPETGANLWMAAMILLGSGTALAGLGLQLGYRNQVFGKKPGFYPRSRNDV